MNPIQAAIQALNVQTLALQADFIAFIQDQAVPLEERWETWVQAPESLKNTACTTTPLSTLPEDYIMYEGVVHIDRYETTTMETVVQHTLDLQVEGREREWYPEKAEIADTVDICAVKEEILQKNLYSITYDW